MLVANCLNIIYNVKKKTSLTHEWSAKDRISTQKGPTEVDHQSMFEAILFCVYEIGKDLRMVIQW